VKECQLPLKNQDPKGRANSSAVAKRLWRDKPSEPLSCMLPKQQLFTGCFRQNDWRQNHEELFIIQLLEMILSAMILSELFSPSESSPCRKS